MIQTPGAVVGGARRPAPAASRQQACNKVPAAHTLVTIRQSMLLLNLRLIFHLLV